MNLALLRSEAKLTQKELAERVGMTQSEISRIERGLVQPEKKTARKLLKALGLSNGKVKPVVEWRERLVGEELYEAFDMQGKPLPGKAITRKQHDTALGDEVRHDGGFGLGLPPESIRDERSHWLRVQQAARATSAAARRFAFFREQEGLTLEEMAALMNLTTDEMAAMETHGGERLNDAWATLDAWRVEHFNTPTSLQELYGGAVCGWCGRDGCQSFHDQPGPLADVEIIFA